MKRSIGTLNPVFNTNRMVAEYVDDLLLAVGAAVLSAGGRQHGKGGASWRSGAGDWAATGARCASRRSRPTAADPMQVGGELQVKARVHLGALTPDDVEVQLFHGLVDSLRRHPASAARCRWPPTARRRAAASSSSAADPLPIERPARFRGARAAAQWRPGERIRAGAARLGLAACGLEVVSEPPWGTLPACHRLEEPCSNHPEPRGIHGANDRASRLFEPMARWKRAPRGF